MAAGGCRKFAFYAGVGCLGLVLVLALAISGMIFMARRAGGGTEHPVPTSFEIPVAAKPPESATHAGSPPSPATPGKDLPAFGAADASRSSSEPVRVVLRLSEGEFDIRPGPPGSGVKVEGRFDPDSYSL